MSILIKRLGERLLARLNNYHQYLLIAQRFPMRSGTQLIGSTALLRKQQFEILVASMKEIARAIIGEADIYLA